MKNSIGNLKRQVKMLLLETNKLLYKLKLPITQLKTYRIFNKQMRSLNNCNTNHHNNIS